MSSPTSSFDGAGTLYLSQRGELTGSYDYSVFAKPQTPVVRRYAWNDSDKRWSEDAGEFAIGLKPPHRSTDGGIALNYGYDATATSTTANAARPCGPRASICARARIPTRVYKGGARVVHGLQATDKGNIRPANEPPYETWFVDNDGQFDDADFYSRVGDIAIYDPCDTLTAAEPAAPYSPSAFPLPSRPSTRHLDQEGMRAGPVRRPHPLRHHRDQQRQHDAGGPVDHLGCRDDPRRPRRGRRA